MYDSPDGVSGGYITAVGSQDVTVHDWMAVVCKTGVVWGPLWTLKDGSPERSLKQPTGAVATSVIVDDLNVVCAAELHARKLTQASISRLENLGYDMF